MKFTGSQLIIVLFCSILCASLHGQPNTTTPNLDSLKNLIRKNGASNDSTAYRLNSIGDTYIRLQPDSALHYLDRALAVAQKSSQLQATAKNEYIRSKLLTQEGRFDDALKLLEEHDLLCQRLGDEAGLLEGMVQRGNVYKRQSKYESALMQYEPALEMAKEQKDEESIAGILNNIALIHDYKGNYPKAVEYYTAAMRHFETAGIDDGAAMALDNLGIVHLYNKDYAKAIECIQKSNDMHRKANNMASLGSGLANLADVYIAMERSSEAKEYITEAEAISKTIGDPEQTARLVGMRGTIAVNEGRMDEGIELLQKKRVLMEGLGIPAQTASAELELGELYLYIGQPAQAIPWLKSALKNASGDRHMGNYAQGKLSEALAKAGNFKEAYERLLSHVQVKDSLFSEEKALQIADVETKYETEKKERIIASQALTVQRHRTWLGLFALLLMIAVGTAWMLSRQGRQQKEINQFLGTQNAQLVNANAELLQTLQNETARRPVEEMTVALSGQDKKLLKLVDILYIKADGNSVDIHTSDGKVHPDWQRLKNYADILSESGLFFQVHRSWLVNYHHISQRKATELIMKNGIAIPIGNTIRAQVSTWLDERQV
jgi:tetratricopeptide (TPR) repeat protein